MRFSFWLRNWKRSAPAARRRTQTSVRQRTSFRPRLEALEDRMLLSGGGLHGTHPSHGGGSGGGSGGGLPYATASTVSQLIADINYANKAGGAITINLKPNTTFDLKKANNTTNGGNALPVIGGTKAIDLTILGNGDTIERVGSDSYGSTGFRLFDVAQGASLILEDVTLQNGWANGSGAAAEGGAIYNQGTLTVSNSSTLSGNSAYYGGGIYNAGGTVKVSNSSILSGNFSHGGGGIYNYAGTLAISNSTLSGNSGPGGGIYNNGGTVALNNSILSGNTAEYHYTAGGGVGGGVYTSGGTVVISHSTLSDNSAYYYGGGIYNNGGTVKVSNSSTLSGNYANYGGAIYNYAGTLTLSNSTLSGNSAHYGGGIFIYGGTVSVSTCKLTSNSATTYITTGSFGSRTNTYGGMGGGIYNYGGTLTINNSDFQNNSPDNIDGTYSGNGNTGLS